MPEDEAPPVTPKFSDIVPNPAKPYNYDGPMLGPDSAAAQAASGPFDGKYGEITTSLKQIPYGEPVFLFRAQDPYVPMILQYYALICSSHGCDPEHIAAVYRHAKRIQDWQQANPDKVKIKPGSPERKADKPFDGSTGLSSQFAGKRTESVPNQGGAEL